MLGVGGAAAIADDQELVACSQRRDHRRRDSARGGEQRRIVVRTLEGGERKFQMSSDRILAQDAPSGLQFSSLVMIASRLRKRAMSLRNACSGLSEHALGNRNHVGS